MAKRIKDTSSIGGYTLCQYKLGTKFEVDVFARNGEAPWWTLRTTSNDATVAHGYATSVEEARQQARLASLLCKEVEEIPDTSSAPCDIENGVFCKGYCGAWCRN